MPWPGDCANILPWPRPKVASTWALDDRIGNFCARPGRVGSHSSNENFTPVYYRRIMFIAHFNAGVRAVDIRDPYQPKEVGALVPPAPQRLIDHRPNRARVIQSADVFVDQAGLIYATDYNAGLYILEYDG